jgi:hypothetical protein
LVFIRKFTCSRSGSGGAGTQTAALHIAGENGAALFATTEEYSGYTWAAGGNYHKLLGY